MIKPMLLFCTAMLLGGAAAAAPSDYPTRPIRLVVNFPPAGPLDLEARAIAQHAGQLLGQTVVVENRSGASGNIGAQSVAQAAADGYTLLMTLDTLMTVNRFIFKDLERDVTARLEPVSLAGSFGMALAVRPELGVASLDEFLSYARSHPISYASAGYGSPGNLAFEKLRLAVGIPAAHVPYRGNAPAVNALLGDQIQAAFLATPGILPHVKAGKLQALAVSGGQRDADLPEVPTVAQSGVAGLKNYDVAFGFLVMAPKGTPEPIVRIWEKTLAQVYAMPEFQRSMASLGIRQPYAGQAQAREWVRKESEGWKAVIEQAGIKAQ
ncbi:ABC transporter substrate-binding protein [Achromobacter sp. HZ01]|jgi:tripartite-type tricarboxylate transporter receptor subunit TctC|uniref:Bug family tripartite tricarboxylate transporter substrate binding protein n=1 Tax=Achromobacter sp. HZ01 TaxID=1416886 RepID=UPI000DC4DF74|nr:tripartite tricarboxylate transporter substrate binding protein [Achromobacter sp. HZ01]MBO9328720.1 tripartite tricarboxylate transporter substrate binding protein [Achromobacter xylosoxidans]RAP62029.1 ABC transporter substrate-binding protein [Achromobacter sp. HZ01]